ncbi:RNA-directed DNA polymerase, eukaryota, reverse transcriptase zinc-binding domain protein [Tanacetum coccineum]
MAVNHFFIHGEIPPGCNSSFIALIPKVPDANLVKDFRPISLIGSIYKIIAKILSNRLVNVLGDIVNEVQSAFIAKEQMLDGPVYLNEILQWCTKKKKTLIFKVDFEKAFDSIRWDFLDDVLKEFGFRCKWRNWIQSCLTSSKGSILVNGCPTNEIVNAGMFKGIVLDQSLCLSHMFYADDAIFLGEWSDGNISTLIHCFWSSKRLQVRDVSFLSSFYYLGTRWRFLDSVQAWQEIVEKVKSRLSKWKSKTLSIGGRLTLLKSVLGSIPVFHMSIFPKSVFEVWERFKSRLQKCPDHQILLDHQIFTFYHEITMIDRDKIMVVTGGNIMHSDESDEDEPSEVFDIQKPIHSLSGNPTPSSDYVVESLSPLPTSLGDSDSLLEETDTFISHYDDYVPDYEAFCFDIEEKSSGSTTSQSDHSLPDYESLCFDVNHIEEKSNGSTISHSDLSLLEYDSFYFDILIDPLPPVDRSDSQHEEFADELAHIISPPEYDHFYFDLEDDPGKLTRLLKENIADTSTKDHTINELNDFPLLLSDCDSTFSEEFSEIGLLVLFPPKNKDKVFNPGIFTINGVHSKRFSIVFMDDFSSILFIRDFLFLTDPSKIETFLSFPFRKEDKVLDPGIILINGDLSFTRKSPHLLNDNFKFDKCHILSEISLKIVSSISFHPKDKEIRG